MWRGRHWPAWAFLAKRLLGRLFREEPGSQIFFLVPDRGLGLHLMAPFAQSWSSEIYLPLLLPSPSAGRAGYTAFSLVDLQELDVISGSSDDMPSGLSLGC